MPKAIPIWAREKILPDVSNATAPLFKERILVGVGRGATTEEAEIFVGPDRVSRSGRDQNTVAGCHSPGLFIDPHGSPALEEKIKFFGELVIMRNGCMPGGQACLGEALVFDWRIGAVEDTANLGTIFGRKWFLTG